MITNSTQTSYSYLRRLLVLPIAAGIILLSSFTIKHLNTSTTKQDEGLTIQDIISLVDTTPKAKTVQGHPLAKNYDVSWTEEWAIFKDPKTHKELFRVPSKQLVPPPPPPSPAIKSASGKMLAGKIIADTIIWTSVPDKNSSVKPGTTIAGTPLIIVDGVPVDDVNAVKPTDIEMVNVLKDASSTALYGTRGANGVILITTKKGKSISTSIADTVKVKEITVVGHPISKESKEQKEITVVGYATSHNEQPDGSKLITIKTTDMSIVEKALEKQNVITIDVADKNGKKEYTIVRKEDAETNKVKLPSDVLYIVDGKEITEKEMKDISPDTIETINVWKGEKAIEKFGAKGSKGVVEVHLKKK